MTPKVVVIAITHATGHVSRMHFVVETKNLAPHVAAMHGFTFDKGAGVWKREATSALIDAEIARTRFPKVDKARGRAPIGAPASWKVSTDAEVAQMRSDRLKAL